MDFCKEIDKYISLYIDETLDDKSRIAFLKHIEECSKCAKKLKEVSYFTDLCREDQDIPLPDDFAASLHSRLIEASEKEDKSIFTFFVYNKKLIASLSTVAVLVISLIVYSLLPQMGIKRDVTSVINETVQDKASEAGNSSYSGLQIDENLDQSKAYTDSTVESNVPSTATISEDTNVHVYLNGDTAYSGEANYSKKDSVNTMPSKNGSRKEKKLQDDTAFVIMGVMEQQYISNYAELNLKVSSKGTEIDDLRKFMLGCGATEKKTITVNSVIGISGSVEAPVDNLKYSDYYLPITLYNNLETQVKKYNLKLNYKTGIIIKDVTSLYENLNTQKNEIGKKIEDALLRGEDTSALETERLRLADEMNEIITGKEMITVRVFYIL